MQPAGDLNLTCYQGATFDQTITWKTNGNPVNLTGYTARMMVRPTRTTVGDPLLSLDHTAGITLGGAAGTIAILATATQTAAMPAGMHRYDLEVQTGTTVYRLLQGTFTVEPEVTR